jgi:glycosyltransferase involved in cell wall biosynthesis
MNLFLSFCLFITAKNSWQKPLKVFSPLKQKKEFELIVVDDGSTDKTNEILQIFSKDPRVVLVTRTEHGGIVKALNDGIGVARGKYIARMDADDIASPDRLMRQLKFLCEHPEVDIVGGAVEIFGSGSNTKTKVILPTYIEKFKIYHYKIVRKCGCESSLFVCSWWSSLVQ